jgi:hypothetical protein
MASFGHRTDCMHPVACCALQVLLENVTNAPPEVLERLNSLTEDEPELNLYEYSEGAVLRAKDGTIHRGFRLVMTANPGRIGTHKMSAAFCNRVVQMWLPELDHGLTASNAEQHDLYSLISSKFNGVAGGHELALFSIQLHAAMKALVQEGKVRLMPGFRITARDLLRCVDNSIAELQQTSAPVVSPLLMLVKQLLRSYMQLKLEHGQDQAAALQAMAALLADKQLQKRSYTTPVLHQAGKGSAYDQAAQKVWSEVADLHSQLSDAVWSLVCCIPDPHQIALMAKQVRPQG